MHTQSVINWSGSDLEGNATMCFYLGIFDWAIVVALTPFDLENGEPGMQSHDPRQDIDTVSSPK